MSTVKRDLQNKQFFIVTPHKQQMYRKLLILCFVSISLGIELCVKSECDGSGAGTSSTISLVGFKGGLRYECTVNGVGNCAWGCCTDSAGNSNDHEKGMKVELVSNPSDGLKVTKLSLDGEVIDTFDSSTSGVAITIDACGCVDLEGSGTTSDCLKLDSDWFRLDSDGSPSCTRSFTSFASADKSFTYCEAGCP